MVAVCFHIDTTAFASGLAFRTRQRTNSLTAYFPRFTDLAAFSAVIAIVFQIDTFSTTICKSCRTFGLYAFAVVAVFIAITGVFFLGPVVTTFAVENTSFECTWKNVDFARTLEVFDVTDLRNRTVRYAFLVLAFFPAFAHHEIQAFSPRTGTFTGLDSLFTNVRSFGCARLCLVGSTNLTRIAHTGFAFVAGAMAIIQALHTTRCSRTLLTFRAIFRATTNAPKILGTFFGRTGGALTMLVFQAGHTFAFVLFL